MGFDASWFNELRNVSEFQAQDAKKYCGPRERKARVEYLNRDGIVSRTFFETTIDLVKKVCLGGFRISFEFRVDPQHIYTFSYGRALRKQWNIGFYACDDPSKDLARIGIGFLLRRVEEPKGVGEYTDFLEKVCSRPLDFNNTFGVLGNYVEPEHLSLIQPLSSFVTLDQPDIDDDWRFFGKALRYNNKKDRSILESTDLFAQEVIAVFKHVKKQRFW